MAGTLRPEKKMYSRLDGYVFQRVQITTGKKFDRKKKVQSSGRQLETGKNYVRKKGTVVWLLVGGQNTKHNNLFFLIPKQSAGK